MRVSIYTNKGIHKKQSEDIVLLNENVIYEDKKSFFEVECKFVGIVDGVGGNAGGKEAAHYIADHLKNDYKTMTNLEQTKQKMQELNDGLLRYSCNVSSKEQMAAVLTGIVFGETSILLIHIGNTRAYVLHGKYLKQLTIDHTMKEFYSQQGRYEEADLCNENEIYACLGGGSKNLARFLIVKEIEEDTSSPVILMTSDGIHDYLSAEDIENIMLQETSDEIKMELLSNSAIKAGSYDDRSIVIIHR